MWKKTGHCKTASFKAWMVTHCTESCGFSCTDLHELAMGIVKVANAKKAKRDKKARKHACPKYDKVVKNYAKYADKYASFSTQFEQSCKMRHEKTACKQQEKYAALAKKGKKGKKGKKAKRGKKGKKAKKAAKKKKKEEEEEEFQEEGSYDDGF